MLFSRNKTSLRAFISGFQYIGYSFLSPPLDSTIQSVSINNDCSLGGANVSIGCRTGHTERSNMILNTEQMSVSGYLRCLRPDPGEIL